MAGECESKVPVSGILHEVPSVADRLLTAVTWSHQSISLASELMRSDSSDIRKVHVLDDLKLTTEK